MTQIMGILNVTPDSFSDGGTHLKPQAALAHAERMLEEGADIIDIGAYSSRPGGRVISVATELRRLTPVVTAIRKAVPHATLSIDTFRSAVARQMWDLGVDIINDITAGRDPNMMPLVASREAGYVAMHMQGTPATMQAHPSYSDVLVDVRSFLIERVRAAHAAGITRVWADPGFGFGKTQRHNYQLLAGLETFSDVGAPVLVGVSRRSMFWRDLETTPLGVMPATSAAHLWAALQGTEVLRTHDVAAARQVVRVADRIREAGMPPDETAVCASHALSA